MNLKLYGIPNCGTCKKALQWLQSRNIPHEFIDLKHYTPSRAEIQSWVATLTAKPLRNTSGLSYRAIGEEKQTWDDDRWIDAFSQDAMLLKRPLWVKDGTAILAGFRIKDSELLHLLGLEP
jgi:arsenate reductase